MSVTTVDRLRLDLEDAQAALADAMAVHSGATASPRMSVAFTLQGVGAILREKWCMDASTFETLQRRRNGSLRKLARELGFSPSFAGALSDMLRGRYDHVSRETENRVRQALGLPVLPKLVKVSACPSCGSVHTGDCAGKPVAQVVVLAPGEGVRRRLAPPAKWVDYSAAALRRALLQRRPYTGGRYYNRHGQLVTDWREV